MKYCKMLIISLWLSLLFAFCARAEFNLSDVGEYDGYAYVEVNNNIPFFTTDEITTVSFESYGELDNLGRCTACTASIGLDLMPNDERGEIGSVKPTGWVNKKYDNVDGKYLYNRCHLIGYQLTGENANPKNLITGTRYLNIKGMLPFENKVTDYINITGNHVMYRVTPIFNGDNLVASGVLMEGLSVEDSGKGISYNVFCYNVQPGIAIDYATGDSWQDENMNNVGSGLTGTDTGAENSNNDTDTFDWLTGAMSSAPDLSDAQDIVESPVEETPLDVEEVSQNTELTYIINRNSGVFHTLDCGDAARTKEENKIYVSDSKETLISQGYTPCKHCNP